MFLNMLSSHAVGVSEILIHHHSTFKPTKSTVGTMRALSSLALFGQFQCVLQPTRALQYVGIIRVAVAFTAHLNATKPV